MANALIHQDLGMPEGKAAIVSQVIVATIGAGFVRPDEGVDGSRQFARYVPFWA